MSRIAITGNVSGTGVFTIASPNSNTDRTLTLPDSAGTMMLTDTGVTTAQMPAGSVLQVVYNSYTPWTTSTDTAFVTTGLAASITPTASSSKVLIQINANGIFNSSTSNAVLFALYKNGSLLTYLDWDFSYGVVNYGASGAYAYLDSPSTTSSTTYTLYWKSMTGSFIGINNYAGSASNDGNTKSSFVLTEIAA